jgi:serine O-acetyltransferase
MTKTPYRRENVCIYANARFWEEIIGRDSIIGNAWITKSIPPRSLVTNTTTTEVKVRIKIWSHKNY